MIVFSSVRTLYWPALCIIIICSFVQLNHVKMKMKVNISLSFKTVVCSRIPTGLHSKTKELVMHL